MKMQVPHDAGVYSTPTTPELEAQISSWREARNNALRFMDIEWARQQFPGASDALLTLSMHKARYDCTDIPDELRHRSAEWLRAGSFGDGQGNPLLPPGQLRR
jgi:hypothetical protein